MRKRSAHACRRCRRMGCGQAPGPKQGATTLSCAIVMRCGEGCRPSDVADCSLNLLLVEKICYYYSLRQCFQTQSIFHRFRWHLRHLRKKTERTVAAGEGSSLETSGPRARVRCVLGYMNNCTAQVYIPRYFVPCTLVVKSSAVTLQYSALHAVTTLGEKSKFRIFRGEAQSARRGCLWLCRRK